MKIAYNPSTEPLASAPLNNDITIDLAGKTIYARGVKVGGASYGVFLKHTSTSGGGYDGLVPAPPYVTTTTTRYLTDTGEWKTINFVDTYNKTEIDDLISGAKTYTDTKIANLVNGAPETLDTLKEISDYLQDSTVVGGLLDLFKKYLPLSGGTITATSTRSLTINRTNGSNSLIFFKGISSGVEADFGYIGFSGIDSPIFYSAAGNTYTLIHSGNIGSQSVANASTASSLSNRASYVDIDANTLTTTDKDVKYYSGIPHTSTNLPTANAYQNGLLALGLHGNGVTAQMYFSRAHSLFYRANVDEAWRTVLDDVNIGSYAVTSSNLESTLSDYPLANGTRATGTWGIDISGSATKLSTARTIWGQSFDGSGNVDGNLSGVGSITRSFEYAVDSDIAGNLKFKRNDSTWSIISSSDSYYLTVMASSGNVGIGTTSPAYKLDVAGTVRATSFIKLDSSNAYLLLGGGGHKAISDFMLKSDELTNNLTTITKTLTVTKDWMDTGIIFDSTTFPYGNGSYVVLLSRDGAYFFTGYLTIVTSAHGAVTSNVSDEIILHGDGFDMTSLYYLRTIHDTTNKVIKLLIARSSTYTVSKTYTFKFKKLI